MLLEVVCACMSKTDELLFALICDQVELRARKSRGVGGSKITFEMLVTNF